jgi:membrane protein
VLGEVYELIDATFGDYARDHGPIYAGALAFYAVLSLIPLAILVASVAGFLVAGSAHAGDAVGEVVSQIKKLVPYIDQRFENDLRLILRNRGSVGLVGAVALLLSASQVFRGLEFALARIFARADHEGPTDEKAQPRSYVVSKLWFGAFLTALVLGFVALRVAAGILQHLADDLPSLRRLLADPLSSDTPMGRVLTALLIVLGFVVLLKVFTQRRVHFRFAVLGGVLFYVLFGLGHMVYDLYIERFSNFGATYGAFATLAVVVLWIYYSATLLLVCCHVVKYAQRRVLHGPRWPRGGNDVPLPAAAEQG